MFLRKNIPGRRESTYKEASQAALNLVGQGLSEGSCEMSGCLVRRRRAEPDYVESCRQRKEFGFDSKCIGKLVKGFKKKNAGLDSHFKMVILPAVWKIICKEQRK